MTKICIRTDGRDFSGGRSESRVAGEPVNRAGRFRVDASFELVPPGVPVEGARRCPNVLEYLFDPAGLVTIPLLADSPERGEPPAPSRGKPALRGTEEDEANGGGSELGFTSPAEGGEDAIVGHGRELVPPGASGIA
jgi:hypothetical protein